MPRLQPPRWAIDQAIDLARMSPCSKSKRGVVLYVDDPCTIGSLGCGFNGPPGGLQCHGNDSCRAVCRKLCIHAEARAILQMVRSRLMGMAHAHPHLVHVKVDELGALVAGGPPSCWPCANLVVETGVGSVWLYEDLYEGPAWTRWSATDFYNATLRRQPDSVTYEPRNGIETPCGLVAGDNLGGCDGKNGAKRDGRGFWRCNTCGFPAP